jgi:hypothetical protein
LILFDSLILLLAAAAAAAVVLSGVVDWVPHIPSLYTHMLACFKVPVGTATAGCPISIGAQHKAVALFGNKLDQVNEDACDACVCLQAQPRLPVA